MVCWIQRHWLIALGLGLLCGIVLGGFWPHTPLYAMASDHGESFAMATGPLDTDVEAVYLLDFLTGELRAIVLGKQPGTLTGCFMANVAPDLGVDPQKNPKFLMVTGLAVCGGRAAPRNSRAVRFAMWPKSPAANWRPTPSLGAARCTPPASCRTGSSSWSADDRFRTPPARARGAAGPACRQSDEGSTLVPCNLRSMASLGTLPTAHGRRLAGRIATDRQARGRRGQSGIGPSPAPCRTSPGRGRSAGNRDAGRGRMIHVRRQIAAPIAADACCGSVRTRFPAG